MTAQGRRMQPCGALPVSWKLRSLELTDAWLETTGSGNNDTVPDAVAGLLVSLDRSTWWKAPQSEMALLRMEASGPVAVHDISTVNASKDPLSKPVQAGLLASITAGTEATDRLLPKANVFCGWSAKQRKKN